MNKVPKIFKYAAIVVSVLCTIFLLTIVFKPKSKELPVSKDGAKYYGLQPGGSSRDEVLKEMGTPVKENRNGDDTTLEYKSQSNPNFNNEFLLRSDKLIFVKQYVTLQDKITIADVEKKYGPYENVLYGSKSVNGFDLYTYSSKGVAYMGHQQAGIVLEIWYFQPTTLEEFKSTFGKDYSEYKQAIQ